MYEIERLRKTSPKPEDRELPSTDNARNRHPTSTESHFLLHAGCRSGATRPSRHGIPTDYRHLNLPHIDIVDSITPTGVV